MENSMLLSIFIFQLIFQVSIIELAPIPLDASNESYYIDPTAADSIQHDSTSDESTTLIPNEKTNILISNYESNQNRLTPFAESRSKTFSSVVLTQESSTDSALSKCYNGDGFYSDLESNCQSFYHCIWSGTWMEQVYKYDCPESTIFDQRLNVCNWEYLTLCT
jgi:hypothetical protein